MDGEIVGYISAAGALSGVLIAVINGIMTRRRTGAETTEKITQAAGGLIDRMAVENQRLVSRVEAVEKRAELLDEKLEVEQEERRIDQERWRRERVAWRHILQVHVAWDTMMLQKLSELAEQVGVELDIPDAPPLTPPTRATDYPEHRTHDPREMS